jgi:hypothetical protein
MQFRLQLGQRSGSAIRLRTRRSTQIQLPVLQGVSWPRPHLQPFDDPERGSAFGVPPLGGSPRLNLIKEESSGKTGGG